MCCFFAVLVTLGPRFAILVWWLAQPARWEAAFSSFFWPFLGFIFAPWTTMSWVALGVFLDIASYGASEYGRRERYAAV